MLMKSEKDNLGFPCFDSCVRTSDSAIRLKTLHAFTSHLECSYSAYDVSGSV